MSNPDDSQKTAPLIMVVDADPHVRELAGYFLIEAGYQVECAGDGIEALGKAKKNPPAAILLELIIPKLNGLSLCRLLKSDPTTRETKIVVLSVLSSSKGAQIVEADAFLSKPLEKTRLIDAMSKIIKPLRNTIL